ncbi:AraC family transcriptional regulator [Paenibacillus qinlingensis]|uniref:AraC-like DNA-binding protein n=1 Tax=Paenibacillus qinlingensis TaxID=1837343 RepID=A0ABU1NXI7_9BACL|nr:AraC family transcriptional regulator [Paenibacillus qinlingensis]MDR6551781.1 AraC-like DNA-binding protein [Paenibacillus qinlingensis]
MWRQPYRKKGLLIAILSACLPAAIIGVILYMLGTQQIEKEAQKTYRNQVAYATERINQNLVHLETIMAQWSFNLNLGSAYSELDIYKDYKSTRSIYQALTWIKASDPLIEEVHLYLDKQQVVIKESSGINPIKNEQELNTYRGLASYQRDVYWTKSDVLPLMNPDKSAPYALIVRLPGGLVETEAALIIEVSAKQLNKLIAELDVEGAGSTLLMQQDGDVISLGGHALSKPTDLDKALMKSITHHQNLEKTSSIESWNKDTYSVSYGGMNRVGNTWTFAVATPLSQMTKSVQTLSRFIILTGCFGIILALILSWYSFRHMYNPVRRLMQQLLPGRVSTSSDEFVTIADEWKNLSRESQILQERVDRQLPSLRESFLLQLMQGHLSFLSEAELAGRMEQFGWDVQEREFAVIAVKLHGLYRSEGKFSPGDEQLVTFAAVNITQELAEAMNLDANTINLQDLTLGLLVGRTERTSQLEEMRANLFHFAEALALTLNNLLHVEVTVCVGASTQELHKLSLYFENARNALNHRTLGDEQQVLDVNDIMPGGHDAIAYPFDVEAAILKALRSGQNLELDELLNGFLAQLKARTTKELDVRQGLLQLFGNMQNTIMLSGFSPLAFNDGIDIWRQMSELKEPEAILLWMKKHIVTPYVNRLHRTQDMQLRQLVENVLSTIHANYAKDISLEGCADLHGTYAKKLSIGFKQITGLTFIDYVTQYRLNKAKQLLLETDEKINDIAGSVGYQAPYFNRLFKKYEGITPGQYREQAEQDA